MPHLSNPEVLSGGVDTTPVPFENKGQMAYDQCLTWHGVYPNYSPRKRRAITVHYMHGHVRYFPTRSHVMEPDIRVQPGQILFGPV